MSTTYGAEAAEALADVLDATRPFIEAAAGLRVDLERRGFSPVHAEAIAASWLTEAHRSMWRQAADRTATKGD